MRSVTRASHQANSRFGTGESPGAIRDDRGHARRRNA
jgi:hypothetical protein